jgi:HAE1 family hydrophobic/amphiphilic exporter-1
VVQIDRGELNASIELPERSSLAQNDLVMRDLEAKIRAWPEVAHVYSKVGYSASGSSEYQSAMNVELVPKNKRAKSSAQVGEEVAALVKRIPGALVTVEQVGILDTGSASSPVSYTVSGPSYENNMAGAKALAEVLKSVEGTGDVRVSVSDGMPELKIGIDRAKLAALGLGLDAVGASLRTALAGDDSLYYSEGGSDYKIKAVLDSFDRTSTDQVANISFTSGQGKQVRLGQFATIRNGFGPTELTRLDRESSITVSSQALGRTTGEIDKDVQAALAAAKLPEGVVVKTSGTLSMQGEAFGSLGFALILSLVLIYAILAILFDSLTHPLSVMFSLPFAMIGGFFALAATGLTLNVFSIMAVILLIGLSAKNAILLLDRALANRKERGMGSAEALREAVATRIRPIVMTTAAMVFGMLPLALGMGSAGEMKQAMGVSLIGGLVFGLLVTMILVPVSFLAIERLGARLGKGGMEAKEIANA